MNEGGPSFFEGASNLAVDSEVAEAASFSSRYMAFTIDFFLLASVYSFGIYMAGYNMIDLFDGDLLAFLDLSVLFSLLVIFGPAFISMAYFTILHAHGGRTIGKAVMGVRVVAFGNYTLGYWRSWVRWIGYHISALPFFAGFLWSVLDVDGRAWHDLLAGSKVVSEIS